MKNIAISEAESLVMQCLWERHPQSAEELVAVLTQQQNWQDATVKTLLNRLLKKEAIRAEKEGRRYLYAPRLKREQWLNSESKQFLNRLFDGKLSPLIAHFQQHKKLSADDIAGLKKLIQELDHDQ